MKKKRKCNLRCSKSRMAQKHYVAGTKQSALVAFPAIAKFKIRRFPPVPETFILFCGLIQPRPPVYRRINWNKVCNKPFSGVTYSLETQFKNWFCYCKENGFWIRVYCRQNSKKITSPIWRLQSFSLY